jgi:hypothetical protein
MTIIVSYDVGELNLPGLFAFLPVTSQCLSPHINFQKKQGKIRLPPELNRPGEILSMRYNKQVRGIVRSEIPSSFSHSIIIDMGTSERIISIKLSRTLELTGPTSFKIAREATETILRYVKECQETLNYLRNNRELANQVKHKFMYAITGGEIEIKEEEAKIWEIYIQQTKGYAIDKVNDFLDFMLNFNRNLYTGTLKIGDMESEMANILFNLGYSINQIAFVNIMNRSPFICKFTNAKSASAVNVFYYYTKIDRTTGQPKEAKHTIRVNKSGHVRHSGPNLETMEGVYYAFIQRVLQHHTQIQSIDTCKQQLKITGSCKALSFREWKELLDEEEKFRQLVLSDGVPIATTDNLIPYGYGNNMSNNEEIIITQQIMQHEIPNINVIQGDYIQNMDLPSLMFDYSPLLATR